MNKISIFGSTGFIGTRFCKLYPNEIYSIPRNYRTPHIQSTNLLYLISTNDNYNINTDPHIDVNTNLTVLIETLIAIKKLNITNPPIINYTSTWFVYGQNPDFPFKEDSSYCNPTGFYSITKRCAEQLIICWCNTFGFKYRIFRLTNILGEGDKKLSKKKNAIQYFIKEIIKNRDIAIHYGGDVLRDYIYINDACNAMKLCMDCAPTNQIYNIASGNPIKFIDVINKTIELTKSTSKISYESTTKFHDVIQVRNSCLDISKISNLGFKCKYTIDDIIKKLDDYYKNNEI